VNAVVIRLVTLVVLATICQGSLAAEEESSKIDEIVVTGSHIPNAELQGPVVILDRETLDRSGASTLAEALQQLTIINLGTVSGRDPTSDALGGAGLSIHGLGVNTTLVLVNGRRVPYYGFTNFGRTFEQFADINSIPLGAISRVEVLKDGASAIYGSDAIAGVVNIVLRDRFEGLEIGGFVGQAGENGAEEHGTNVIWGMSNEQTNITLMGNYSKREPLLWRDREISKTANHTAHGGRDRRSITGVRFWPSDPFDFGAARGGGEPLGAECDGRSVPGKHDFETALRSGRLMCLYDFNLQIADISDERLGATTVVTHQTSNNRLWRIEANISSANGTAQQAPIPFNQLSPESMVDPEKVYVAFPATNPWNPFGEDVRWSYRMVEAGPRINEVKTDSQRFLTTLTGEFRELDWEVGALYAHAATSNTGKGRLGAAELRSAMNGIDFNGDGLLQPDEYWNPYSPVSNPNSEELAKAAGATTRRDATTVLYSVDGHLSGRVADLAAGEMNFAAGFEHRYESLHDRNKPILTTTSLPFQTVVNADRRVNALFAELRIPLLAQLELQPAARYEDFSDFGSKLSPRVALRWQPWSWLIFRGSWGEHFRAPTLIDLYMEPTFEHMALGQTDPIRCPVTGDDYDCAWDVRKLEAEKGDTDTKPETAETVSAGFTFGPIGGFRIAADYWQVDNKNKVGRYGFFLEDRLALGLSTDSFVRDDPTPEDIALGIPGRINQAFRQPANIEQQRAEGYDIELDYVWESGRAGTFDVRGMWSHLISLQRINIVGWPDPSPGDSQTTWQEYAGRYGSPQDRANLNIFWQRENWGVLIGGRWISDYEDTVEDVVVPAHLEIDLQLIFNATRNLRFVLGIENLRDESPPFAHGAGNRGYSPALYDMRGRYAYARATYFN